MQTVSFTMVKNEEDIIESFVRYNLKSIDHMYIADNLSTDGTLDILQSLKDEGLPLTITIDSDQAYTQNAKMTKMYRAAFDREFAFAFLLDADEFLDVDSEKMHATLDAAGSGTAYYIPRTDYLYGGEGTAGDEISIFNRMTIPDLVPVQAKSMIFHEPTKCKRFRIGFGNHHIRDWSKEGVIVSRDQDIPFARLRHFPIRSVEQYMQKSLLGWLALQIKNPEANTAKGSLGSHWRSQYRLIMERDCQIGPDELMANLYGGSYAERRGSADPLNADFDLRYAHLMRKSATMTQMVKMYETTIENIWADRKNA